jgi:hypothetical protein
MAKNGKLVTIGVIFIVIASILVAGCTNSGSNTAPNATKLRSDAFTDHGNGVMYFKNGHEYGVGSGYPDFGDALSEWLSKNPSKQVISVVADGSGGYGATAGFYVVVR